jgi:starch phosphorylase
MIQLQTFEVFPLIPEPLCFLGTLARNLWWSWQKDAMELFRRINPRLWEESGRNPIVFLTRIPKKRLEELELDDSFLSHQNRVKEQYEHRVNSPVDRLGLLFGKGETIAYCSMEFGIHESLPLFAGGLGVLAGDHLKSASEMALPLTGIGLLYHAGYFRQFLDPQGWQQEDYPVTDIFHIPVERASDFSGNDLRISISGPEGPIHADVWKIKVGQIPLYLLDANILQNPPPIRSITARLYAGDPKIRLAQEILLGMGGMQALDRMRIYPKVLHMNEGHSAFASLERLALIMSRNKLDLKTALEIVYRSTIFTTHTPVAAGHDEFPVELVKPYLQSLKKRLGTTENEILSWGQLEGAGPDSPFSLFVLALHMAQYYNGVSALHGKVARKMWSHVWPERLEDEVPITHVTNGIHITSYISTEFANLFNRYLEPEWFMGSRNPENIHRIDDIYDEDLWRAHEINRSRLIRTCRELMTKQFERHNAPPSIIEAARSALDQDTLTVGFARRFTTYKRANLILKDPERLETILGSENRPVQFIFAGKAHPKDNEGKELIRQLIQFSCQPHLGHKFIFIEDYDMHLARILVQGADVWLNNPRRPYEACGTSGMKAAINGVLNVSILDGWWCEGYSEERGWAIGHGEEFSDDAYQDAVESQALYNVLEYGVIPCFYDRRNGDAPKHWIRMMKASMKMAMQHYCSFRMLEEYENRFYVPAAERFGTLMADGAKEAGNITAQIKRLRRLWKDIRVETVVTEKRESYRVGEKFLVTVEVFLGELRPDEVAVELCYGPLKSVDVLGPGNIEQMTVEQDRGNGWYRYAGYVYCRASGRYGVTARITPQGDARIKFTPKLITWAKNPER